VLAALGQPQLAVPSVLVAGTNGKGSTAALLAAIAAAAGYRAGLYTSPHLEEVQERIRIDGRAVDGDVLGAALRRVVTTAEPVLGHLPTYFEALTAAAFSIFAAEAVDLMILEVGLGGRLDATNASEPELSLITPIGLEHREYLGETLTEIAREKAGVLRRGRTAVAWPGSREAREAISAAAVEAGARLRLAPSLVEMERRASDSPDCQGLDLISPTGRYRLSIALPGEHQAQNVALAVLAAEELGAAGWEGFTAESIVEGVGRCRWPGRMERVRLPDGGEVLLDVAHNPDGIAALRRHLDRLRGSYDLLFGALADKEVAKMLPLIARGADRIVLTRPDSPRALRPEKLQGLLSGLPSRVAGDGPLALDQALLGSADRLVVCGSVYLVGEVRRLLTARFGTPPPAVEIDVARGG
jgi:dihydrofolate synthase/folylpolyglutamate synthase